MKKLFCRMRFAHILTVSISAVMMAGCNVHEWPVEPVIPPEPTPEPETPSFVLHLDFDTELPLHTELNWSRSATDPHDVRYKVLVYEGLGEISAASTPISSLTLTGTSTVLNRDVELELDEGQYSFLVWADYVDSGSSSDKYYSTGTLSSIVLSNKDTHPGSNPYRDAFRGQSTGTVIKSVGGEATVSMKRPMGRFEFITTDLDAFVARVAARESQGGASRADVSDYTVTFRYIGFMPSTYNLFTDKPIDAWTGVNFNSSFEPMDDGTNRMGYDYVLVNGSETAVSVAVEVRDGNGNVVSSTPSIEVPIVRSKLTVVKGEFMSMSSGGGAVIEPGYDGDYNIEIR